MMCAARRDGHYGNRDRQADPRYPSRGSPPRRGGYPQRPGGGTKRTEAPAYNGKKKGPKPSDSLWGEPVVEAVRGGSFDDDDEPSVSKETLAMVAGVLYMLMATYIFFMFFWRDGGREPVMFQFALVLIMISAIAVFLSLSHDLKFMPSKVSIYWTNFISGLLTMIVLIVLVKMFKDFSTGKYDFWDDLNVVISVTLGTGATYLLFHSMWYERKEPFVQDRVPISYLSGFAWAGLGGFFYFFFLDDPFTRLADASEIFYIGVVMVIIGSLAVFFNLLGSTSFAPGWATRKHMNFLSGMLFGVLLFIVLITALMFNADPYEVWDTVRVMIVTCIGAFAMASGVFSMGM